MAKELNLQERERIMVAADAMFGKSLHSNPHRKTFLALFFSLT